MVSHCKNGRKHGSVPSHHKWVFPLRCKGTPPFHGGFILTPSYSKAVLAALKRREPCPLLRGYMCITCVMQIYILMSLLCLVVGSTILLIYLTEEREKLSKSY